MADIEKRYSINIETNAEDISGKLALITDEIQEQKDITIEFKKELLDLERQLKATPANALSAQKDLKDRMDSLKDSIKEQSLSTAELNNQKGKLTEAGKQLTKVTALNTDAISKNGGAMGLLNMATGGVAQTFKDALEASTLFSGGLSGAGKSAVSFIRGLSAVKAAILTTGIGVLVIALGYLAANWDKVTAAIKGTSAAEDVLRASNDKINASLTEVYTNLFKVQSSFNLAKYGVISKKEALDNYNNTLGDTLGKASTLEEAEKLYVRGTGAYVQATLARTTAQILLAKAAEEQAKISTGEIKELSGFWQQTVGVLVGEANALDIFSDSNLKTANKNVSEYTKLAEKQLKIAEGLDNKYKINTNKDSKSVPAKAVEGFKKESDERLKILQAEKDAAQKIADQARADNLKNTQTELEQLTYKYQQEKALLEKSKVDTNELELKYLNDKNNIELAQQAIEKEIRDKAVLDKLALEKKEADEKLAIVMFNASEEARIEKEKNDVISDSKKNLSNTINGIEATGLAKTKAGQILSKSLALTQIGIDSAVALSKASTLANAEGVAAQLAFPTIPGIGTVARIASYVSTAASVASNIVSAKKLLSSGGGGNIAGNGGGNSASIPASAQPNVNFVTSSENQIGTSVARSQGEQAPIKTYVLSKDVNTQAEFDRNIENSASL